jgi:hypothetical protein
VIGRALSRKARRSQIAPAAPVSVRPDHIHQLPVDQTGYSPLFANPLKRFF